MLKKQSDFDEKLPFFPLLEVFGGAFGILVIILVFMLFLQGEITKKQRDPTKIGGIAQMKIGAYAGYVISCFPDYLRIEKTKETITLEELNSENNAFRRFCKAYLLEGTYRKALFFLYPNSNNVLIAARKNLIDLGFTTFNFFVINQEIMDRLVEIGTSEDTIAPISSNEH